MKKVFLGSICLILLGSYTNEVIAQASVPGYHDPAVSRNRLIREQQGEGVYKIVGSFKVTGNPYLFGLQKMNGDLAGPGEKAENIDLGYNTYNQEIEFYSTANPDKPLVKTPGTIDSFVIKKNIPNGIMTDMKFVYGKLLAASEKAYMLVLASGPRFTFVKRYKSELGYVSTNYTQSELRQFDLIYDYFYYDAEKKTFKKLKFNVSSIVKEFKAVKDVSGVTSDEEFSANPEEAVKKIFDRLNS